MGIGTGIGTIISIDTYILTIICNMGQRKRLKSLDLSYIYIYSYYKMKFFLNENVNVRVMIFIKHWFFPSWNTSKEYVFVFFIRLIYESLNLFEKLICKSVGIKTRSLRI